ncbi:hypothetical protein DFJ58DRAFT_713625 [Suillus subalutaceus]|uniref:uncharacterized protein n=1 Tax=Suillus subalutaceus TaxID=48586 RepID=UPI001B87D31D|nr:uncharacterized protein DFJ58DRAFT_713625 [Suillus subalutaceus]KAG1872345.1 hypothetical protein DFJ58DRAFT_713625 [Suillus subalutaceus]
MSSPDSYTLKNLYDLNGLIALVTGGGTGIGLNIARGLAANGAKVYITGRRKDVLDGVVAEWNAAKGDDMGLMIAQEMDVTKKESIKAGVTRISQTEGKLHILVNNAGQSGPVSDEFNQPSTTAQKEAGPTSEYLFNNESFEEWGSLFAINTSSIYFVTIAVINITSISGLIKVAQRHFCYNSSKAAGSHLTRMLSTEFALKGINVRVNAIAPGVYESEMTHDTITGQEATDSVGMPVVPVPARRAGTAAEMAGTAVYLASPAAAYMNGQELVIDGGYLAVNPSRV